MVLSLTSGSDGRLDVAVGEGVLDGRWHTVVVAVNGGQVLLQCRCYLHALQRKKFLPDLYFHLNYSRSCSIPVVWKSYAKLRCACLSYVQVVGSRVNTNPKIAMPNLSIFRTVRWTA